jgi:hypothetical protein
MRGPLLIALILVATLIAARAEAVVDLLFRPVSSDLTNFGPGTWNVRFRPTRDVRLTGLGLIFDPAPATTRSSLSLGLWQDEVISNDDRLATLTAVMGDDFNNKGLNSYVFRLADYPDFGALRSINLEQGRPYILTAELDLVGRWPEQLAETQQLPFMTQIGGLVVLGGGRDLTPTSNLEHPPLLVELDTQAAPFSRWNNDSSGDWSAPGNWRGGVPDSSSATALFGGIATQPRHILIHEPVSVGRMDFNNANSYTIIGSSSLLLASTSGEAEINVIKGSHAIDLPLSLATDTLINVGPTASTLSITAMAQSGVDLTKEGGGVLVVNNVRAAGLSVNRGTVRVAHNAASAATSVVGRLAIAGTAIAPAATLDMTNNSAVIDYTGSSPVASVRQQIVAGRGGPGMGAGWNGMGITSSAVASANSTDPESRSVAYAENATLPLGPRTIFRGQPVDDTSVLIAFARTGDANLDGVVNDDDVTIIGATYAPGVPQPSWALGDFDYNGFVDDDDVTLLGAFYNPAAAPLTAAIPPLASNIAPVPEPGAAALAATLAAVCLVCFAPAQAKSRRTILQEIVRRLF